MIRFAYPWLLGVALVALGFALWRLRGLPAHFGRRRRAVQVLMALALIPAALAAGGLEWKREIDRMAVVFAVDRSRSTGLDEAEIREALAASAASRRAEDMAGLVVFAANAATEVLPSVSPNLASNTVRLSRDGTDIGGAIRRALADLPAEYVGRIVLVSDGVETRGDALAAASVAASRGVTIDVWPIEREPGREIAVERVRVPPSARPGEPVEIRAITRATEATRARVQVLRDGDVIAETVTDLAEGTDALVLRDEAPGAGVHRYDVVLSAIDEDADQGGNNNSGGAFMRVSGGSQVLVLSGQPSSAQNLVSVIERQGSAVTSGDITAVPVDLAGFAGYDLVVLNDLPARAMSESQMHALHSYVRDLGGGLLMAGARDSFGLGGYVGTPVEEALPARFDLRQRRDRLSLAMVIGIDNSGSMGAMVGGGRTKLDLANEAAARSAMLLGAGDRVGVVHVDTSASWTQPMTLVDDPMAIAERVRHARPGGGGIYVDVTMEASFSALRGETTQLKHFLLFSDGSDSAQMGGTREQVRAAARDGITTSIVSMGRGPDSPELEVLSRLGGGRFYIVEDMTELPRIFTQETIEASRAALSQDPFRVGRGLPHPITQGIDLEGAPMLLGHSIVNTRRAATVLIRASEDDALLSHWQHGLGRSAVYTTDLGTEFGIPWLSWNGLPTLFDQLSRDLYRAPESGDASVSLTIEGGVGHVRVEVISARGQTIDHLTLRGTVAAPGGDSRSVTLRQTGPGRYEGTFDADAPGPYLVSVGGADAAGESGTGDEGTVTGFMGSAGIVRNGGDELRGEGTNHALLQRLAALTGGQVFTNLTDAFRERPAPIPAHDPMARFLLMFSLMALLLSVAARRLVFKRTPKREARPEGVPEPSSQIRPSSPASLKRADHHKTIAGPSAPAAPKQASDHAATDRAAPDKLSTPPAEAPGSLAERLLAKRKKR